MPVTRMWSGTEWVDVLSAPANMVTTDTAQTISATKTFTLAPLVPNNPFEISKVNNLQVALDSKYSAINTPPAPTNMMTTDTSQVISAGKNFSGGASFQTGGGNFTVRFLPISNAQLVIDRAGTNWPGIVVDGGGAPLGSSTLAHWTVRGHSGNTTNDLYQGQNSSSTVLFRVKADGGVVTTASFTDATGQLFSNIEPYAVAVTGTLTVQTGKSRIYLEHNYTIESIRASVNTAPTGAPVIVDVNLNGTSVYTTQANRPTIAVGTNTSKTTPNTTTVVSGQYLTVDVDGIGSTVAGADLTVVIRLRRT